MTPAVKAAERARVAFELHQYPHDPGHEAYGLEAAEKLGLSPQQVFKTLIAQVDGRELVAALVPVHLQLDLKALAMACGGKKAAMAAVADAERSCGYVTGGISPLGQRKRLPTVIDQSVSKLERVFVSAGKRGLEIEIAPSDLISLCAARTANIARER